jgi:hypothetical protein
MFGLVTMKKYAFHVHRPVVRHGRWGKGEIDRRGLRRRPPTHLRASAPIGEVISTFCDG